MLRDTIAHLNPDRIAVNTSRNNVHADGLTHAMYEMLRDYLGGTPYADRFVSAEPVINSLRGRKTPTELARIKKAVEITDKIYRTTFEYIKVGMTEVEIGEYMHRLAGEYGVTFAWPADGCPAVNSGPNSPVGQSGPTDIKIERGHIIHFDFGVKYEDYCSDIQRVCYVLREGETEAPPEVQRGFIDYIGIQLYSQGPSWGSDHYYFWEYGNDAVFQAEFNFNDYYHSEDGTIDQMNITYATRFSRLILATLAEMAQKPRPVLEISSISGGFGVTASITNIGDETAIDVTARIIITGGLFGFVNKSSMDEIEIINPRGSMQVKTTLFKFGKIYITATVDASNADQTTKHAEGFIIGPVVFNLINLP